MKYPILYNSTETNFNNNGIGVLNDCISCEVTEERNGQFELVMRYPTDGNYFDLIQTRMILKAKPDRYREPQLFRIYAIKKPMLGAITINAAHISYDLNGIPVKKPYSNFGAIGNPHQIFNEMKSDSIVDVPFTFESDIEVTNWIISEKDKSSFRSILFDNSAFGFLYLFGGEYEFDNFVIKLHKERGQNRGVVIRYGKNLTSFTQDENVENLYTGVFPFWCGYVIKDGYELFESVFLPEEIVEASGVFDFVRILPLDLSNILDVKQVDETTSTAPTTTEIREYTQKYIETNKIGIPDISTTLSFEQLAQSSEYANLESLERISLCDYVNIEYPRFGISTTAEVVKMVYDVLNEKIKSVTIGTLRKNIADTIAKR